MTIINDRGVGADLPEALRFVTRSLAKACIVLMSAAGTGAFFDFVMLVLTGRFWLQRFSAE